MIENLKNEFSSFFSKQNNLKAASLYFIFSIALESLPFLNILRTGSTEPYSLLVLSFRLLQIGTGIWIVIGLLPSKIKDQDYTRLIGLYLIFSILNEIVALPNSIRALVMAWGFSTILRYIVWISTRVTTILSTYIYIKIFRKQIDQNLFLLLSINQIMYIIRLLYYTDFEWMFRYIPEMEANVYLIGFCASLGIFSILAILFFEVSGRKLFFNGDERRVVNWLGVALFVIGFRSLTYLFSSLVYDRFFLMIAHYQGLLLLQTVLLPIIQGIQAITLIYLSIRVRAHVTQE